MAQPLTYASRPLSFAVPAKGGTAILPQTVALGVIVKVTRANDRYFGILADGFDASDRSGVAGRLGSVWWDEETERWAVERNVPGFPQGARMIISRFREAHLREAIANAIIDTTCEYMIDRDNLD